MDLRWVEDFLCLARLRSFSRASEARHITQSAFSRRIRSLENWFGAPLVDRSVYPATLTAAGEDFLPVAADIARQMYDARANAAQSHEKTERTVTFAAQHSLSLDFFARWAESMERVAGPLDIRLTADNYYDAMQSLREGACDFLLCFTHPKVVAAPRDLFESRLLGRDFLIPVSAPSPGADSPLFCLPGDAGNPVPYLSYGPHSFLGKVVLSVLERHPCSLSIRSENAFGESLRRMALRGRGVVWIPESMVADDIAARRLLPAGKAHFRERLNICLFRRHEKNTPLCEKLWGVIGRAAVAKKA